MWSIYCRCSVFIYCLYTVYISLRTWERCREALTLRFLTWSKETRIGSAFFLTDMSGYGKLHLPPSLASLLLFPRITGNTSFVFFPKISKHSQRMSPFLTLKRLAIIIISLFFYLILREVLETHHFLLLLKVCKNCGKYYTYCDFLRIIKILL